MKWKLRLPFTDLFSRRFDLKILNWQVFWLTSSLNSLPVLPEARQWQDVVQSVVPSLPFGEVACLIGRQGGAIRLTAAGTAPVSHRIPFSDEFLQYF
jgi:hypothetical protein